METIYERKDKKIQPIDERNPSCKVPGSLANWEEVCLKRCFQNPIPNECREFDKYLLDRLASFSMGSRLNEER